MDFQRFFDDSIDFLCCMTRDGYMHRLNKRWSMRLGWSDEELMSKPIYDFLHSEDSPLCLVEMEGMLDDGEIVAFENRLLAKDGTALWVQWNLSSMGDGLLSVTARDIHETVMARDALVEQKRSLEMAAEMANLGAWRMDSQTGAIEWADNHYGIFGKDPTQFTPDIASVVALHHPADQQSMNDWFKRIRQGEALSSGKARLLMPDGSTRYVLSQAMPSSESSAGNGYHIFGVTQDVTEQEVALSAVQHAALHDPLTGLGNRTMFYDRLQSSLALSRRTERLTAVLMIDLDRFKEVNDVHGHPAGDQLLIEVASRLKNTCRESDTVARLGGDEFAIVCTSCVYPENIETLCRRIMEVLARSFHLDGTQYRLSASLGISMAPNDGDDPETLLCNADIALYKSKRDGRGIHRFFQHEMDAMLKERRKLIGDLKHAIVESQLEVHYQPVLDVQSQTLRSCEALVRWRHPERGLIPPGDFIPIAEETGLIVDIGAWVLRRACEDAMRWPDEIRIAVNVSAVEFKNRNLVKNIHQSLMESGLDPHRLEIEITETALLENHDEALSMLNDLKAIGIRIVLDDFGIGYSSLRYLRSFPFQKIKLDRSFVAEATEKAGDRAIIRAVSSMASELGMESTAEGVETSDHFGIIESEGYTHVQGFLFSKPRPVEEIMAEYFSSHSRSRPDYSPDKRVAFPMLTAKKIA